MGKRYAIPDPEWDSLRDRTFFARTTRLGALPDRGVTEVSYTYDLATTGDTLSRPRPSSADPGADYPIDRARAVPYGGYRRNTRLRVLPPPMANGDHEQHGEPMRWHRRAFDREHLDVADIQARIAKLARRRAMGKAAFAKKPRPGQLSRPDPPVALAGGINVMTIRIQRYDDGNEVSSGWRAS